MNAKNKKAERNAIDMFQYNFRQICDGVATLDLVEVTRQGAIEDTQSERIERLLTIYAGIRPLLSTITAVPLFPAAWRNALKAFINGIDALAILRGFKAGRDL
ncbi:MAG TPA: hypothetical protein VF618_16910 [Thermoanaerobaculia bacterium]